MVATAMGSAPPPRKVVRQHAHQPGQLRRRFAHGALRHRFAFPRGVEDMRRQRCHLCGVRRRRPTDQVVEMAEPEGDEQALEQGGRFVRIVGGARRRRERPPPEPVAAAFVAELPPVAAGAVQPAVW